jgi:glycosyltransferase involved in cell wall biosynthesis
MTRAIDRVLADSGLARHLSAAGRARAKSFTWARAASAHIDVYEAVASR